MNRAAITVNVPLEEVRRQWRESPHRIEAETSFQPAPGDRGTEIHVVVPGGMRLEHAKDRLRRFKQVLETGRIARSDAAAEGATTFKVLKQRPAQPLETVGR